MSRKKFPRLSEEIYKIITSILEEDEAVQLLSDKSTTPYESTIPETILDRYQLLVGLDSTLKVIFPYPNTNIQETTYIQMRVYCPGLGVTNAGIVDEIDVFIECFMSDDVIEFKENVSGSYKRKFRHYELASIITTKLLENYLIDRESYEVTFFTVTDLDSNGFRIALTMTDFSA